MAREIVILDRSRIATSSLATNQFSAVTLDTNGQIVLPAAGADIYGVLQDKPAAGHAGEVRVLGVSKMVAGAAGVNAGDKVMVDASGHAVTATTGNFVVGIAEDTAASGQYTTVLLRPGGKI